MIFKVFPFGCTGNQSSAWNWFFLTNLEDDGESKQQAGVLHYCKGILRTLTRSTGDLDFNNNNKMNNTKQWVTYFEKTVTTTPSMKIITYNYWSIHFMSYICCLCAQNWPRKLKLKYTNGGVLNKGSNFAEIF